jgi:hypothetical protein
LRLELWSFGVRTLAPFRMPMSRNSKGPFSKEDRPWEYFERARERPELPPEERAARKLLKRIRKLRWRRGSAENRFEPLQLDQIG